MSERTVIAWFVNVEDAEKAKRKIQSHGVDVAQIREVSLYPSEPIDHLMNPITGNIPGLARLTFGAQLESQSERIMAAASPSASGMSGDFDLRGAMHVQLTVVCDPDKVDYCVETMKACHGLT